MRCVHLLLLIALAACRDNPSTLSPDPDAGGPSPAPSAPPSASSTGEADVSARLHKVLSLAYPDATVTPGTEPKTLVVRWQDGRSATVAVDKVEKDCATTPGDCDAVMRRAARVAGLPAPKLDAGGGDARAPRRP